MDERNEDKLDFFIEKYIDPTTGEVEVDNVYDNYVDPVTGEIENF